MALKSLFSYEIVRKSKSITLKKKLDQLSRRKVKTRICCITDINKNILKSCPMCN